MTRLIEIIAKSYETEDIIKTNALKSHRQAVLKMLHAWIYRIISRNNSKTLLFVTKMQKEIQLYYAY